ncbi:MAG: hypothetical protein ACFFFT_10225 [Candidatus Thorarchaeota archaeon]
MTKTNKKIIIIESSEIEEKTSIENEMDEILGDLNPKYFEEGITFKEAKERIQASVGSKFDFSRPF